MQRTLRKTTKWYETLYPDEAQLVWFSATLVLALLFSQLCELSTYFSSGQVVQVEVLTHPLLSCQCSVRIYVKTSIDKSSIAALLGRDCFNVFENAEH